MYLIQKQKALYVTVGLDPLYYTYLCTVHYTAERALFPPFWPSSFFHTENKNKN